MCVAYILYHPRTALASCTSHPQADKILELLNFKGKFNTHDPYLRHLDYFIFNVTKTNQGIFSSQPSLRDSLLNFDWGAKNISSKIELLQNEILQQTTTPKCFNAYGDMVGKLLAYFCTYLKKYNSYSSSAPNPTTYHFIKSSSFL
jgi:hypothetical protein